jgi:O-antigen/teichoic acid export membrane protein
MMGHFSAASIRRQSREFGARLRQRNGAYLAFSMAARALMALGMFLAIRRFAASSFGEMAYLQATALSAVAFSSFGIELSINSRLSRNQKEGLDRGPTIVAGCVVALCGMLVACGIVNLFFSSQINPSGANPQATLAVCTYASLVILISLVNATAFASNYNGYVGFSYTLTAAVFMLFAVFADKSVSGVALLRFQSVGQVVAGGLVLTSLVGSARQLRLQAIFQHIRSGAVRREVATLVTYGVKQIVVVSLLTFSQWLIQRKIVFGPGGASDNAIYSIGNQIFNIITFLPTILGPIIVTKFASAGGDTAARQKICVSSLRLFGLIALGACVMTFLGLYFGVRFLPPRYADCVETGFIASLAAAVQVLKAPFSLYFLSELKVSREIASAILGALFMIVATALFASISPNGGTVIRLIGGVIQGIFLGGFFLVEYQRTRLALRPVGAP